MLRISIHFYRFTDLSVVFAFYTFIDRDILERDATILVHWESGEHLVSARVYVRTWVLVIRMTEAVNAHPDTQENYAANVSAV